MSLLNLLGCLKCSETLQLRNHIGEYSLIVNRKISCLSYCKHVRMLEMQH